MAKQIRKWKKIEPASANEMWHFNEDPVLEGEFVDREDDVGKKKSTLFSFKKEDGSLIQCWGYTVLSDRLNLIEKGDYVRITFKGEKKSPESGNSYYDFDVEIDESSKKT